MSAALVLGFVLLALFAISRGIGQRAARRSFLAELAAELGGSASTNGLQCTYRGVATRFAFETRGSGSHSESWTYVECALPAGYPFTLHVDRHGFFDAGKIERGTMVDVVVGDQAFDGAFRVEGAPAAVVQRVLTAPVRAYLLAQPRVDVATEHQRLRLAVRGWLERRDTAGAALDCATAIAGAVRGASLALDAEAPTAQEGPAYRAIASDAPLQEVRAARAAEVRRVEAVRASRRSGERVAGFLIVAGIIAAAAAFLAR